MAGGLAGDLAAGGAGAKEAEKAIRGAEGAGKEADGALEKFFQTISGGFTGIGRSAAKFGLPFAESVTRVGEKLGETEGKSASLGQKLSTLGGVVTTVGAVALVGFGAEAVRAGDKFASATDQISSSAEITVQQATAIGNAFKGIKGEESATELAQAFAPVAGELAPLQGSLTATKAATDEMGASADLADAKLGSLDDTTGDLASVMSEYGIQASKAGDTSDVLYGVATQTGQGLDSVTSSLTKLHTQLGVNTPSLAQTGALLLDLKRHGETGRQGLSAVSTALNTLLKQPPPVDPAKLASARTAADAKLTASANAVANAEQSLQSAEDAAAKASQSRTNAVANAEQSLQAVRDKIAAGTLSGVSATDQLAAAQARLSQAEQASPGATDAVTAAKARLVQAEQAQKEAQTETAQSLAALQTPTSAAEIEARKLGITIYNSKGQFVGIQSVIAQLQPKLEAMTPAQQNAATAALFGATANSKLLTTILAGPQAFAASEAAVTKTGTAHSAAAKQMDTLSGEGKELGAELDNLAVTGGQVLIPVLKELGADTAEVIAFFEQHKAIAEALAGVIGGVLSIAVGAFAVNKIGKLIDDVGKATKQLKSLEKGAVSAAKAIAQKFGIGGAQAEEPAASTAAEEEPAGAGAAAAEDLDGAASKLTSAEEGLSAAAAKLDAAAEKISAAADKLSGAGASTEEDLDKGGATAASDMTAAGTKTAAEVEGGGTGAATAIDSAGSEAATEIEGGAASAAGTLDAAGVAVQSDETLGADAAAGTLDAAGAEVMADEKLGATASAATLDAAGAEVAAEERLGGAGGIGGGGAAAAAAEGEGAAAAEGEGAAAAETAGGVGASSILPAGIAGLTAYQLTSGLLKSNFLGTGSAVTSAAGAIGSFFGVGQVAPKAQAASSTIQFLEEVASGQPVPGNTGVDAITPASARAQLHQQHVKGYAAGGNPPVGVSSVIGEDGPEIWTPNTAGAVLPNSILSAAENEVRALSSNLDSQSTANPLSGVPASTTTIFQIENLVLQGVQNPAQLQQQLQSRARTGALSGNPMTGPNLGVGS